MGNIKSQTSEQKQRQRICERFLEKETEKFKQGCLDKDVFPVIRHTSEEEVSLHDYLRIIFKHRWMILSLPVAAMLVTVIWSLQKPRIYQAITTIVPPVNVQQGSLAGRLDGLGSSLFQGMLGQGDLSEKYVGILKSRVVSDALIDRFDLVNVYEGAKLCSDARRVLHSYTDIKAGKDGIVSIRVSDPDPKRAAAIANSYVEELDKQNKRLSSGQVTSKRIFLENRLNEVQQELKQIDNLQAREAQTKEILFELLLKECELAKIEEAKSMPTIQVLDQALIPELGLARGTANKGIAVGVGATILGIFFAFSYEYAKRMRLEEACGSD